MTGEWSFLLCESADVQDGISQNELSEILGVDKGITPVAMKKLTEAGYIKRKTDPSDSRSYRLFLTESGIRIGQELGRLGRDHETMLTEGFSNGERDYLFSLLQKAAQNARRVND